MLFMNEWEVEDAVRMFKDDDVLGPATRTLENLMRWTNRNSDGWCYWNKPVNAAKALMELIQAAERHGRRDWDPEYVAPTAADVRRAYRPIKAFLTRMGDKIKDRPELVDPEGGTRAVRESELTEARKTAEALRALADVAEADVKAREEALS